MCYDSDNAGEKAAERALEAFSGELIPIRHVTLPDGLDPDIAIQKYGKDWFVKKLAEG